MIGVNAERGFEGVTLAVDATRIATAIRAVAPGRFLRRYPARVEAFVRPGQLVGAGATLGLIALGPVLVPIRMPEAGFVLAIVSGDGLAVGYGDALVEIATLAELRTMGILT